jgi:hypothetical protein
MASFGLDWERVLTAPTGERIEKRRAADERRVSRCIVRLSWGDIGYCPYV